MKITREILTELIQECVIPAHDRAGNDVEYDIDDEHIESWTNFFNKNKEITKVEVFFEDENKKEYSLTLIPKGEKN
jgi:hypothetical protein